MLYIKVLDEGGNIVFETSFDEEKRMTKTEIRKLMYAADNEEDALQYWRMLKDARDDDDNTRDANNAVDALKDYMKANGYLRTRKPSNVAGIIIRDREDAVIERFNTTARVASFLGVSSMLSWERCVALLKRRFPEGKVAIVEKERKI